MKLYGQLKVVVCGDVQQEEEVVAEERKKDKERRRNWQVQKQKMFEPLESKVLLKIIP